MAISSLPICLGAEYQSVFDQLVYISRAVLPVVSPLDVVDILDQAARQNPERQLTGALTYVDDQFVQIIEGPQPAVDQLMETILKDKRHAAVEILERSAVRHRSFPDWAMLFPMFTPETAQELAGMLKQGSREGSKYRELLIRMGREQTQILAAA